MSQPLRIDHLVYAVPDLDTAVHQIAQEWGVRPIMGGKHPTGTHNALLALGPHTYLEIIAPDPQQHVTQGRSFGLDVAPAHPVLVTWAAATADLDATIAQARRAGYDPGPTMDGSRSRPDGARLSWRSTRIGVWPPPGDGVVPFLIEWGAGSVHPASDSPQGCRLLGLRATHPAAAQVNAMLSALGIDIPVEAGATPRLTAQIETPRGVVEIK